MAERENKKSLKDRAQELIHDVVEAVESIFSPSPQLIPVRSVGRPARRRSR